MDRYNNVLDKLLSHQGSPVYELMLNLLDAELSRLRELMDEADVTEFKSNQGGIRLIKKLKSDLEPKKFIKGQDGAYM